MENNFNNVVTENEVQEVHKYMDCDFYWVELDENGVKVVCPRAFVYDADDYEDEDEPDLTYRLQWYDSCFAIQIDELHDENFDFNEACCENMEYIEDLSKEDAFDVLDRGWGETEKLVELPLSKVDENTPCGWYVNYPRMSMI